MVNYTLNSAAVGGAAFPGVSWSWPTVSGVGANYVRMPDRVPAAGNPDARRGAFPQIPAMVAPLALMGAEQPTAITTRTQNVKKTHVSAGGLGALGPHPEREPA